MNVHFFLNGNVDELICRYWCDENRQPQKCYAWHSIIGNDIIVPSFTEKHLTDNRYLNMLEGTITFLLLTRVSN